MATSRSPQREPLVDAFVLRLAEDPAIEEVHLPAFRAQIVSVLDGVGGTGVRPDTLTRDAVDRFVDSRSGLSESPQGLKNMRTAGHAFVDFLGASDRPRWIALARERGAQADRQRASDVAQRRRADVPKPKSNGAPISLRDEDRSDDGQLTDPKKWATQPWTLAGLGTSAGVAAMLLLRLLPVTYNLAGLLRWMALAGAFYSIVNHVSRGRPGMPYAGNERDALGLGFPEFIRGTLTLALVLSPAIFASYTARYTDDWSILSIVACAVLLLVGAALGPAAIVAGEVTGSTFTALFPGAWFRLIWRMPRDYAVVARWSVVLVTAITLWEIVGGLLHEAIWPEIPMALVGNMLWFSLAALCGRLIHLHEDDLGLINTRVRRGYDQSLRRN